jgi:hypothetical protein
MSFERVDLPGPSLTSVVNMAVKVQKKGSIKLLMISLKSINEVEI